MATKKQGSKSTALVPWSEKFAKYAKASREQVKNVGGGGAAIKFGRGTIAVSGNTVPGGKLKCVILGYCALNAWWDADYDKDDVQPPDCYAYSDAVGDPEMAPHPEAADKQAETCAECEKNQFGTARTGRGKACSNTIKLAALTAADCKEAEDIPAAELAFGRVSPTNMKHFAGYVKMLEEEHGRPPWAVVTEISSFDDPDTQIRLEFKLAELIDEEDAGDILDALERRADAEKIQSLLQVPYGPKIDRPKPAPRAGRSQKFAGRAGARR